MSRNYGATVLHQVVVRANAVKLDVLEMQTKSQHLLLHEGNDAVESEHIAVVKLLPRLGFVLFALLDCRQGMHFDQPSQVKKIVS
jgi:hypothetical protein